jgi:hypothetical protein
MPSYAGKTKKIYCTLRYQLTSLAYESFKGFSIVRIERLLTYTFEVITKRTNIPSSPAGKFLSPNKQQKMLVIKIF